MRRDGAVFSLLDEYLLGFRGFHFLGCERSAEVQQAEEIGDTEEKIGTSDIKERGHT